MVRVNLSDPELKITAHQLGPRGVSDYFESVPYFFDPSQPISSFKEVRKRGYAACAEAGAAIAAASIATGGDPFLCLKKDDLTNSAHASILEGSQNFDPYRQFYFPGKNCADIFRVLHMSPELDPITNRTRPGPKQGPR